MPKIKLDKSQFKYINQDLPDELTKDELQKEIRRLETLSGYYYNKQLGEKIIINSSYGALASKYFVGFNLSVAASVTEMGRAIVKYGANILNKYYKEYWHKDVQLHKQLGLLGTPQKIERDVLRYGDSVDGMSYLDIEYDEYELGEFKFSSLSKLFVTRNNKLHIINAEECLDDEKILYVIDYIEMLKELQDANR